MIPKSTARLGEAPAQGTSSAQPGFVCPAQCHARPILTSVKVCPNVQMGHSCLSGHLCKDRHNKASLHLTHLTPHVCEFFFTHSKLTEQSQTRSLQILLQERLQSGLERLPPLAPVRRRANAGVSILRKSRLPRIGHLRLPAHQGPHR